MSAVSAAWVQAVGSVLAILAAIWIAWRYNAVAARKEGRDREERRKGHWAALGAEIELCREHAQVFLKDSVMAPSYRLPTIALEISIPALLSDGQLSSDEYRSLVRFYLQVSTLNRGLEQANAVRDDGAKLDVEYERNFLKATELVRGPDTLYNAARQVVEGRRARLQPTRADPRDRPATEPAEIVERQ